jgi:hypothetical protein
MIGAKLKASSGPFPDSSLRYLRCTQTKHFLLMKFLPEPEIIPAYIALQCHVFLFPLLIYLTAQQAQDFSPASFYVFCIVGVDTHLVLCFKERHTPRCQARSIHGGFEKARSRYPYFELRIFL